MQRDDAAKILQSALSLGNPINVLDSLVSQLPDSQEKTLFVQALGNIMGILTRDIVLPIVRQHPDLDPDK
jgi:hypothetical protein